MQTLRTATVAALLAGCLLAASGRASAAPQHRLTDRSAVRFLAQTIRQIAANDYATAWATLYPPQQSAIPQAQYIACESADPVAGTLVSVTPERVRTVRIHVAGGPTRRVKSLAVTFRIVIGLGPGINVGVTHTVHAVAAGGRWAWILSSARFAYDRTRDCPAV